MPDTRTRVTKENTQTKAWITTKYTKYTKKKRGQKWPLANFSVSAFPNGPVVQSTEYTEYTKQAKGRSNRGRL